jgi:hypothetical protein
MGGADPLFLLEGSGQPCTDTRPPVAVAVAVAEPSHVQLGSLDKIHQSVVPVMEFLGVRGDRDLTEGQFVRPRFDEHPLVRLTGESLGKPPVVEVQGHADARVGPVVVGPLACGKKESIGKESRHQESWKDQKS